MTARIQDQEIGTSVQASLDLESGLTGSNTDADYNPPFPYSQFDEDENSQSPFEPVQERDYSPRTPKGPGHAPLRECYVLQQWEGVIDAFDDASFSATIHDMTNPENPPEVVEIPLEELSQEEFALARVGGVFYWSIMYEHEGGTRRRVSEIRMRRLPKWTNREISQLKKRAKSLLERL